MEQLPVSVILKKAAEKLLFKRARFQEKNIPTTRDNICCLVFFGDIRSEFAAASLLLRRFREESKGSKYFILCSWPGYQGLFPFVDEYWEPQDSSYLKQLYLGTNGLHNSSDTFNSFVRILNTHFEEVLDDSVLRQYYDGGFKQEFFSKFKHIKVNLPTVPSSTVMGQEFNRQLTSRAKKVFIHPVTHVQNYKNGRMEQLLIPEDFWKDLVVCLDEAGYSPVIYQNFMTFDLSSYFFDKFIFFSDNDILHVLSVMRACNYVLDVFSGISRLAIGARAPFLCCQDRNIFNFLKDYEIDDLVEPKLPKEYIYSFPEICALLNKTVWKSSLFNVIISKLDSLSDLHNEDLPSPIEVDKVVLYSSVRNIKQKKLGVKFIKIPKC